MKYNNILETIGNTPVVKINHLFPAGYEVYTKVEKTNPGGSIKDRIGLFMIENAEKKGVLKKDTLIVEPTSGNTGIGLALAAAVKGYKIILVMPESMSIERRKILKAYGADIVLTPKETGMKGAIDKVNEMAKSNPKIWIPGQFDNDDNNEAHRKTTALEILKDFPKGLDYIISGVGTGGHLTGVSEVLKKHFANLKTFAVEPDTSAVISGEKSGPHKIQGIGAGFIPQNCHTEFIDGIIKISAEEAYDYTRKAAREEGLFIGISSGASLAAISKKIKEIPKGSTVLTFCYDGGDRYLSVKDLF